MRLTPWEEERLLIFTAAELARRHRAAGLLLNAPEAIALVCDAMLEVARAGGTYEEVEAAGMAAVPGDACLPGVPPLVDEVRLEVLLDEGTRLVVLRHPLGRPDDPDPPGGIEPSMSARSGVAPEDRERRRILVRNTSQRVVRVSSHYPFHRVNQRLAFDRAAARGFRLDIGAGETVRWAPGEEREVELVAYGGAGGAAEDGE